MKSIYNNHFDANWNIVIKEKTFTRTQWPIQKFTNDSLPKRGWEISPSHCHCVSDLLRDWGAVESKRAIADSRFSVDPQVQSQASSMNLFCLVLVLFIFGIEIGIDRR